VLDIKAVLLAKAGAFQWLMSIVISPSNNCRCWSIRFMAILNNEGDMGSNHLTEISMHVPS
jgi:hypothetical protein